VKADVIADAYVVQAGLLDQAQQRPAPGGIGDLYVLRGLGVEEQAARQAIARAAASDWMVPERRGREVCWSLGPRMIKIIESGAPRVFSLSDPYSNWDGTWLAILVTIPQSHRSARRPLYSGLTWAGLGNPVPGLWLGPHVERAAEVGRLIDGLGLRQHTISFVGTVDDIGVSAVRRDQRHGNR